MIGTDSDKKKGVGSTAVKFTSAQSGADIEGQIPGVHVKKYSTLL